MTVLILVMSLICNTLFTSKKSSTFAPCLKSEASDLRANTRTKYQSPFQSEYNNRWKARLAVFSEPTTEKGITIGHNPNRYGNY